jgi:hypothetical protein
MPIEPRTRGDTGGGVHRVTRRAAIATGAAAYGAGMLWGSSARASRLTESDGDGTGTVYAFNCCDWNVDGVVIQGTSVGGLSGWSPRSGPIGYTPAGLAVPLSGSEYPTPGQFVVGDNSVEIQWASGANGFTTITVPSLSGGEDAPQDEFVLMLGGNSSLLLSIDGNLQGTFQIRVGQ